jgi:hypothetical protein
VVLAEVVAAVLRLRGVDVELPAVGRADEIAAVEKGIDPPDPVNAWAAPRRENRLHGREVLLRDQRLQRQTDADDVLRTARHEAGTAVRVLPSDALLVDAPPGVLGPAEDQTQQRPRNLHLLGQAVELALSRQHAPEDFAHPLRIRRVRPALLLAEGEAQRNLVRPVRVSAAAAVLLLAARKPFLDAPPL